MRCLKLDDECKKKEVDVYLTDYEGNIIEKQKTADLDVGGGLAFTISHIDEEDFLEGLEEDETT